MTNSISTHATAIEGSTVTELENQLLFDEGISAKGRSMAEQLMNLDLKGYEKTRIQVLRLYDLLRPLAGFGLYQRPFDGLCLPKRG